MRVMSVCPSVCPMGGFILILAYLYTMVHNEQTFVLHSNSDITRFQDLLS